VTKTHCVVTKTNYEANLQKHQFFLGTLRETGSGESGRKPLGGLSLTME